KANARPRIVVRFGKTEPPPAVAGLFRNPNVYSEPMKTHNLSRIILTLTLTVLLAVTASTAPAAAAAGLDDKAAFAKMKSLTGDWTGKDCNGHHMKINIHVIAGG